MGKKKHCCWTCLPLTVCRHDDQEVEATGYSIYSDYMFIQPIYCLIAQCVLGVLLHDCLKAEAE